MDQTVSGQLEEIRSMETDALCRRYREIFGEDSPAVSKDCLRQRIAWQMQAAIEGDISESARRQALKIAGDVALNRRALFERTGKKRRGEHRDRRVPRPGTELTRVFGNRTVVVKILDAGFECDGRLYGSLSAAARAVTGTRWNGLVFFGLAKRGETAQRDRPAVRGKREAGTGSREENRGA